MFCNVLEYMSLMCEDARGCRRDAGNFRGVCPKIGRKSMRHIPCSSEILVPEFILCDMLTCG